MKQFVAIMISVAIAGFLLGRVISESSAVTADTRFQRGEGIASGSSPSPAFSGDFVELPRLVTSESLESLVAQGDGVSYGSLALWLVDADAAQIAGYWHECRKGKPDGDIKRLVFLNWMRVDPAGAIAATAGTEDAEIAWWAWSASDPQAALAAAGPEQLNRVAKGIGEFQPGWLCNHFSEFPDEGKDAALAGLATWKETDDPQIVLDLFLKINRGFQPHIFQAFAIKDPWAAFDWLERKRMLQLSQYNGRSGGIEILIEQMKAAYPEDLERMAAMMPAGKLKRIMEEAAFENLIATDPIKALKAAKETEAPLMAAKRLSTIGAGLLATEPEEGFDIAAEILEKSPGGLSPMREVSIGNSSISWGGQEGEAAKFFDSLMAKDPTRTLDMAAMAAGDSPGGTFRELADTWAKTDLKSYASWVNRQTEPAIRTAAINTVVNQLRNRGSYEEAGEWAMTSPDRSSSLQSLGWVWGSKDKGAARTWFEAVDIPAGEKQRILKEIEQQ